MIAYCDECTTPKSLIVNRKNNIAVALMNVRKEEENFKFDVMELQESKRDVFELSVEAVAIEVFILA